MAPRVFQRIHFSVQGRTAVLYAAVVAAADDPAFVDEHAADRNAAFGEACFGFGDGGVEKWVHKSNLQNGPI